MRPVIVIVSPHSIENLTKNLPHNITQLKHVNMYVVYRALQKIIASGNILSILSHHY